MHRLFLTDINRFIQVNLFFTITNILQRNYKYIMKGYGFAQSGNS